MLRKGSLPAVPALNTSGAARPERDLPARRVWVKRPGGMPTSIFVKETDLVDDLKTKIALKFPTTLGRDADPADLVIRMESQGAQGATQGSAQGLGSFLAPAALRSQSPGSASKLSPIMGSPLSPIPVSFAKQSALVPQQPSSLPVASSLAGNRSPLSPDFDPEISVWSILDTFFPGGMTADCAFVVDCDVNSASTPSSFPGRKQIAAISEGVPKDDFDDSADAPPHHSTVKRINSLPISGLRSSTSTPNSAAHRRSHSSSQEPGSAAVLLLPKDLQAAPQDSQSPKPASLSLNTSGEPAYPVKRPGSSSSISSIKRKDENSTMAKVLPSVNVLIVEDNLINLRILSAHLRRHRIHYDVAKNGQEAIDKWRKGGFHLVLMDIQLPVLSGLEASKEIRRLEKINGIGVFAQSDLQNLPEKKPEDVLDLNVFKAPVIIVALTASNMLQDKQEALGVGCNDYLTKPVNLDWLLNKIIEWGCMQALIDFDGWKSGERMTNISAAIPTLQRKISAKRSQSRDARKM